MFFHSCRSAVRNYGSMLGGGFLRRTRWSLQPVDVLFGLNPANGQAKLMSGGFGAAEIPDYHVQQVVWHWHAEHSTITFMWGMISDACHYDEFLPRTWHCHHQNGRLVARSLEHNTPLNVYGHVYVQQHVHVRPTARGRRGWNSLETKTVLQLTRAHLTLC